MLAMLRDPSASEAWGTVGHPGMYCRTGSMESHVPHRITGVRLIVVYLQLQNRSKYGCTYFRDTWPEELVAIFFF